MFDHYQGMALRKKFLKSGEKKFDIGHMEACGGFVEDEKVLPFLALNNVLGQLEPLGLSSTQRVGGLAKDEILQSHISQDLKF